MTRKYLLKKDKVDVNDHLFARPPIKLPTKVDLRSLCSPIVDQGQLGSCTANAIVSGSMEFNLLKVNKFIPLSRLYLYYKERELENSINIDAGASLRDGIKIAVKNGVCPESDCVYDISKFTEAPSAQANIDAGSYRSVSYQRITSLKDLKRSIAENYLVVLGISVFESFESDTVSKTGIIPLPKRAEKNLGGHAVCCVGYDDSIKMLICRNSWSKDWGIEGYFLLPYNYFTKYSSDAWTLR